ncbi:MAG: polysaccharide deacetylase family protein [Wujia sp.]
MSESKKNKNEYVQKKSDENKSYNRRNVDNIKKLIILTFLVVCALPIIFCLYMMVRVNALERKLDDMYAKFISKNVSVDATENENDYAANLEEMDQQAYAELEINTTSPSQFLTYTDDNTDMTATEGDVTQDNASDKYSASEEENIGIGTGNYVTNGKTVYLTFDDGPSVNTDMILDVLAANNVKATFFLCYNPDESVWPMYKRIADEGHTVALHSYSHVYKTIYADKEAFIDDVTMIHDFVYEQTGVDSKLYRFPGGSSNTVSNVDMQILMEYLYDEGYTYFDWNALNGDAVNTATSPQQLNDNVMYYVRNNAGDSIVLMHDLGNVTATAESLQDLIDTLRAEGYTLAPIDENTVPVQHVTYKGIDE